MPDWLPEFITPQLIASVTVILVIIHLIAVGALYLVLLERKLSAWMQDRCGPNRVGPLGLLQPIADAIVQAIVALRAGAWSVAALQDYFPSHSTGSPPHSASIATVEATTKLAHEVAKNR